MRARFLQVLEGHVKEIVGKSDFESEARSRKRGFSHGLPKLGRGDAEAHEEGEDEEEALAPPHSTTSIPIESA